MSKISKWFHDEKATTVYLDGYRVWFKPNLFWKVESLRGSKPRLIKDKTELRERLNSMGYRYLEDVEVNPFNSRSVQP